MEPGVLGQGASEVRVTLSAEVTGSNLRHLQEAVPDEVLGMDHVRVHARGQFLLGQWACQLQEKEASGSNG